MNSAGTFQQSLLPSSPLHITLHDIQITSSLKHHSLKLYNIFHGDILVPNFTVYMQTVAVHGKHNAQRLLVIRSCTATRLLLTVLTSFPAGRLREKQNQSLIQGGTLMFVEAFYNSSS